jgi:hypothetical protein
MICRAKRSSKLVYQLNKLFKLYTWNRVTTNGVDAMRTREAVVSERLADEAVLLTINGQVRETSGHLP